MCATLHTFVCGFVSQDPALDPVRRERCCDDLNRATVHFSPPWRTALYPVRSGSVIAYSCTVVGSVYRQLYD